VAPKVMSSDGICKYLLRFS